MSLEHFVSPKVQMRQVMRDEVLNITPMGEELYRSGEPVVSRSLHLAASVVLDNLPPGSLLSSDIIGGFRKTFPQEELIIRSDEISPAVVSPVEITVDYFRSDRDPQLKKSYTAVSQGRSERTTSDSSQLITVINGELVVTIWEGRNRYKEYFLHEAERFPIEQGKPFSAHAGKGWAIYHASYYPRVNEGRHIFAMPRVLNHIHSHNKGEKSTA